MLALVGPTASGKTDIALALAQRFGAEIIGADSRQVYRGLDIGSAKPTAEQRAAVPHHLIDVVEADENFDCARFRDLALAAVRDIEGRGKRVLLVGGTGLYIKVLRRGLFDGPRRDDALRARLVAMEEAEPGWLHRRLASIDPTTAARLHPNDHVRLVRGLEVFEISGRPISLWQAEHGFAATEVEMHVVGLELPRPDLYARIESRCRAMVEGGLIDEVQRLLAAGLDPDLPSLRSPGYAEIGRYVRGLCSLEEARREMAQATRRLAKRQVTWFRGHPPEAQVAPVLRLVEEEARQIWEE